MDQRGAVKGIGGAAGCGRSAETVFLVDRTCFLKTRKDTFSSFSEFKVSCSRIIFRQSYSMVSLDFYGADCRSAVGWLGSYTARQLLHRGRMLRLGLSEATVCELGVEFF